MDNQQGQRASPSGHDEETKSSTAVGHSRPEQIRYLPMPAGPTVVNFPPHFTDILSENRLAQAVTVDQQGELTQYVRGLNGWMEREFEERHDDLRRLRTAFEQMGRDVRDLDDDESTSPSDNGLGVPELSVNRLQLPPAAVPNQRGSQPVNPQPHPIVVMIPTTYAPRPIPAVPRRFRPRQLLPPAQQPGIRVSPEPPIFIPPDPSGSGGRSSRPATPTPTPEPGNNPNVTIISASSSSSPNHDIPGNDDGRIHRRRVDHPVHPRRSMGSDVSVVPLSSASTPSSPARGTSRLAQRPSVTSLQERGILRRTPSGRSERPRTPLVVTNHPSPVTGHTLPGPTLHPTTLQPISVLQQSYQPQPMIQRFPSPLPAAVTSTSGIEQIHEAEFPILRPPPGPARVPVPISSPVSPVFMPGAAMGREMTPHPPAIIRQHSPVSGPRRVQTPFQPAVMRTSPTRLSKRHRPQPTHVDPVPVILPQPSRRIPPPLQPEVIRMPARTDSRRHRPSHHQLRPIDVVFPTPAVTAMTYPEKFSRVRTTAPPTPFIIPVSSSDDFQGSLRAAQWPVVIRRSPSLSSSRRRSFTTPFIPRPRLISAERPVVIRRSPSRSPSRSRGQPNVVTPTQRSRLTKRRRPQPTTADPVLPSQPIGRVPPRQPDIVLMPARTESTRNRQNRRQLRPIDTSMIVPRPVTAMTYPETVGHARTSTAPFIIPQPSPTSSRSSLSIRRSPSRSSSRHRAQSATTTPSRLTKRPPPPPQPEIVIMPARTESIHNRQSRRQLRPNNTPIVLPAPAVTALTYPETVSHGRTIAQHPRPRPISSNSSFRSSMQAAEQQPVVIRRSPSSSPSRRRAPPDTRTQPSRLTKRRGPQPISADPIPPPPQPENVVMPSRTESMRSRQNHHQLRPIDTSTGVPTTRAVTAMTFPETVSHVRTTAKAPTIVPLASPTTSNSSFRASMQPIKQPVVIPSRSSFRSAQQHTTARPGIVVLPPRSNHSTDSSPIIVSTSLAAEQGHHQISAANGALSDSPHPQSGAGAIVMPLDSDADEVMGFRQPVSRRPSFSGRDMISYDSRSRAYSSGDDDDDSPPACITPTSFRGRARSPHVRTPTSRQSQSPPRVYRHHPDSTDLWDQQKSRAHSQRGWYQRRSSGTESVSPPPSNPLLQPPVRRGSNKVSGPITNTFSIRGEIRTHGAQQPYNGGEVIARGVLRGGLERPRERSGNVPLAPDSRLKRTKSSWSGWLAGL